MVKAPRKFESSDVRTEQQLAPKDTVGIPAAEFWERESTGTTANDSWNRKEETFFVDRLVSYYQPSYTYRARWAGCGLDDDTWEPPPNITFNLIFRFHCLERQNYRTQSPTNSPSKSMGFIDRTAVSKLIDADWLDIWNTCVLTKQGVQHCTTQKFNFLSNQNCSLASYAINSNFFS